MKLRGKNAKKNENEKTKTKIKQKTKKLILIGHNQVGNIYFKGN